MAATRGRIAARRIALLALLVLAATVAAATPARAADQLVWEGLNAIEISNEDGSNRRWLTSGCNGISGTHPAISPDGQTVAFSAFGGSICTVGVDGQSKQVIVGGASATNPEFTADGKHLLFEALPNNGFNIYKSTINGAALTPVITWAGDQSGVTVHPSGQKIAFSSDKTPAGKALSSRHIYVTDMSGLNPVDVGIGQAPAFSSDGSKIVFEKGGNIYTAASTGGRATQLTTGGLDGQPDWSPNGQIAFIRRTSSGVGYYNVWRMTSTGSGQTMIVSAPNGSALAPSFRQSSLVMDRYDVAAADLRPTLLFDSGERWRPINVNWFLGETHQICDGSTCGIVATPDDLRNWPNPGTRINIEGDGGESNYASPAPECNVNGLQDCDTGPRSAIYYHVSEPSPLGYPYVDYWWFYRYNDTPDVSLTDHEGDWESVSIAPSDTSPGTFDFASFSGHGHWYSYLRDNLGCDGGPAGSCGTQANKYGKRLNVFVAAGSHANYGEPCGGPCTGSNTWIPEMDHDGAYLWGRHNDPPADSVLEFPATTPAGTPWTGGPRNWTDWPGMWSADGGIDSPGNQPHFKTPWDNDCADASDCPFEGKSIAGASRGKQAGLPSCSSWFGAGVAAVACDPARLKKALKRRELGRKGTFRIARQGKRPSASAPGIAQALGQPLRAGATLSLAGSGGADADLLVRVRHGKAIYAAVFGSTGLGASKGKARVKVGRPGVGAAGAAPRVALVRADGTTVKPLSLKRMR